MNIVIPEECLPWGKSITSTFLFEINLPDGTSYGFRETRRKQLELIRSSPTGRFDHTGSIFDTVNEVDKHVRKMIAPIIEKNWTEWGKWLSLLTEHPTAENQRIHT